MTKTNLLQFYSIVKIVKAKDLPKLSKTYKDSQERLLVMFKKRPKNPDDKIPSWFKKWNQQSFAPALNNLIKEIKGINARLDGIESRLDKCEQMLRSHDESINYLLKLTKILRNDC